jgi:hypothetical protein
MSDRLRSLIGELDHAVEGALRREAMEIASKAQDGWLAISNELAAQAKDRLADLVRARIAEAEEDFFQASQALEV